MKFSRMKITTIKVTKILFLLAYQVSLAPAEAFSLEYICDNPSAPFQEGPLGVAQTPWWLLAMGIPCKPWQHFFQPYLSFPRANRMQCLQIFGYFDWGIVNARMSPLLHELKKQTQKKNKNRLKNTVKPGSFSVLRLRLL